MGKLQSLSVQEFSAELMTPDPIIYNHLSCIVTNYNLQWGNLVMINLHIARIIDSIPFCL